MRLTRSAAGIIAAIAALVIGLSACGPSGDAGPKGVEVGASAPASPSSDLTQATFADAIAAGLKSVTSMHVDLTYRGRFADAGKLTGTAASDVVRKGDETDLHMTTSVAGRDLDLFLIGSDVYVGLGEATGGRYVHATMDKLAKHAGLAKLLDGIHAADMGAQARAFAAGITSFTKKGTGVVDGTAVTIYTMTVDPSKVAEGSRLLDPAQARHLGKLTATYSLDAHNVPLRVDVRATTTGGQSLTISMHVSKLNQTGAIVPPPADQTIELSDLAGALH
ncbi:hypothetical protein [Xylanimonas sp. McL0601]|uniref:hypothetical protein n=1 Tax=Xylanimonas sp. McL0601 TaxID=3414739 RepID=UPI003CF55316